MRKIFLLFVIPALLALPSPAAAGELKLSIQNGLVTLSADDVPLSMIMAEWSRIGGTKVVNGERLMTRVTLNLVDMPERRALEVVLRSATGFMAAERRMAAAGPSAFESIMILPTSTPPANSGPLSSPSPFVPRPVPPPPVIEPDHDEPELNPQPQPPGAEPNATPGVPNAPLTAPRPGQLPAPPPQQPVPFGTPPRPPGGGGGPGGGGPGGGGPGGGGGGGLL